MKPLTRAVHRRKEMLLSDSEAGFSMVEMIVAIVLFLIVSTALLGAILGGIRSTVTSEQRTRANETATQIIEGLRSVPWDRTGFYKPEYDAYVASAGHTSPPLGESAVIVGTSVPSPRPVDTPHLGAVDVVQGSITYHTSTWITWVGAPNDGSKYAAKRFSTDVSWTVQGIAHQLHAEGVRAPVASEMTPTSANPASRILSASITPDADTATPDVVEHNLDSVQKTTTALNFTMTTDIAATTASLRYTLSGSATPTVVALTSSNAGKSWSLATPLPVGSGPFDASSPVPFLFSTRTATGETDATTKYVTFKLPAAVAPFTITSASTPAPQQLTAANKTPAALAFSLVTNRAASSAIVQYSTTSGAATDLVLSASDGIHWSGSLAAGAGPFSSSQAVTFTYVTKSSPEMLVQQQSVGVAFTSAPVAAPQPGPPTGTVAVNKNSGVACSANTTISFSVTNAKSTDPVTVTYNAVVGNAAYSGTLDAGGAPVFTYKWATNYQLVKSGTFPITIKATSAGGTTSSPQTVTVTPTNNGQC